MLTRRHIRIKVMQAIYALSQSKTNDLDATKKFLLQSMEDTYDLYLLSLSFLRELHKMAKSQMELSKKKYLATEQDKNPNTAFVENKLLHQLSTNLALTDLLEKRKLNDWDLNEDYLKIVHKEMVESPIYAQYISTGEKNYTNDKKFIIELYKQIIAPNDKIYEYLEDHKLTWVDDIPLVNTYIIKLFKKAKESSSNAYFTPDLFKDLEDKEFAIKLLNKTLMHQKDLEQAYVDKTVNWDKDRIAELDSILLQMGICELQHFPSIPTKVSMNEYLELAKEYSTPKSSIFINGILDKLVKQYQAENKLNKMGRGLL
ncbi:MAG: transcription antitermination factor NusB [Flavobacteriaceae bacterium]|nr:transcription antitermination factor NusB [Flavobacteriaceae bacterium]